MHAQSQRNTKLVYAFLQKSMRIALLQRILSELNSPLYLELFCVTLNLDIDLDLV